MNFILRWLRRLSASDTAVRAVEQSLLDWKHEVDQAPGVLGAFASDFRMAAGIGRLILGVLRQDIGDALRHPWAPRMLAWLFPMMGLIAIVTYAQFQLETRPGAVLWWWGLAGAALPYAAFLTIARADRQPPALGLFILVAAALLLQIAVYSFLHPLAHVWVAGVEWLLLPAMCMLLGDRIRREPRRGLSIGACFATWITTRVILASMLGTSGGYYDRWIVWIVPVTPAILWMWFVWKQDHSRLQADVEEVTA